MSKRKSQIQIEIQSYDKNITGFKMLKPEKPNM